MHIYEPFVKAGCLAHRAVGAKWAAEQAPQHDRWLSARRSPWLVQGNWQRGLHELAADQADATRNDRSRSAPQSERWETTLTSVPLGSRSMKRRTPHSSSRSE